VLPRRASTPGSEPGGAASPVQAETYADRRRAFFATIPDFWADVENDEYAQLTTHSLTGAEAGLLREAARAVGQVFRNVAPLLRALPDENLLQLGLPPETLHIARYTRTDMPPLIFGRMDFLWGPDGPKLAEFNTDTPAFTRECFEINGRVCEALGVEDINTGEEARLTMALGRYLRDHAEPGLIGCTSLDDHIEDTGTTRYIQSRIEAAGLTTRYVPVADLRVTRDALRTPEGERLTALYRLYPMEWFAEDCDSVTGDSLGLPLFDLVHRGRLTLLNPPPAFLLQSKGVLALIWGLYEDCLFLSDTDRAAVERYFLPTYLDPLPPGEPHVIKPVFGREGHSIQLVGTPDGEVTSQSELYADQRCIWQKYVPLPHLTVPTTKGQRTLRALYSVFLVESEPSAIGLRVDGPITGDEALFIPLCLQR
jgi:glutathionylspermidine synthase